MMIPAEQKEKLRKIFKDLDVSYKITLSDRVNRDGSAVEVEVFVDLRGSVAYQYDRVNHLVRAARLEDGPVCFYGDWEDL